jgi:hypothetical protein
VRNLPQLLIRVPIGIVMAVYGMHQLKNPQSWFSYIPRWLENSIPMKTETFMRSHGSINVGLGLLFISGRHITFVSWATFAWWLSILPFAARKDWRTGMRDFAITASVLAIAVSLAMRK